MPAIAGSSGLILGATLSTVLAGGVLWMAGERGLADAAWAIATAVGLVPLTFSVAKELLRRETGVDLIALLAMAGSLVLGQYLAGAVIALMLSGGEALERYADTRARRELIGLVSRAPHEVHRYEDGELITRSIDLVLQGDLLLVKPGEVVPVDGVVASEGAVLDEAALTGESMPVQRAIGERISSGVVSCGAPFDIRAVATAGSSTYAGIVRLVREAAAGKAPFVRLANQFALWFLGVTILLATVAWLVSGDPIRALAVLVIATPCPLILAAPVAVVAGISRAAQRGIIVKGGGALEKLARARTLVFDKTGTLTAGRPKVDSVIAVAGFDAATVLRLAASLDQVSPHVFADAIVGAAREKGMTLEVPEDVTEYPGRGIEGMVASHPVRVGQLSWLAEGRPVPETLAELHRRPGSGSAVYVSIDDVPAGALVMMDPVRSEAPEALRMIRNAGIDRIVLLSGDRQDVAESVGRALRLDTVFFEQSPEQKIEIVGRERRRAVTVMVGDGINDAPALASADVGIAMGARGATAASEAADAVILVDRIDRVAEAVVIAQRTRHIALESVIAGMILSIAGMCIAMLGALPPVAGAVAQEAIDVAVILNALRALVEPTRTGGLRSGRRLASE